MLRFASLFVVVGACACANDLDTGAPPQSSSDAPHSFMAADTSGGGNDVDAGADGDAAGNAADDNAADDAADDNAADDNASDDNASDVDVVEPAGPPPAVAGQSCSVWSDCGPNYSDPNSGFDCVAESCVCNADGNWDDACASIGGVWSDEDCFCYVHAAPMPSEDADSWVADDEEDTWNDPADEDPRATRTCWWRWRETCDADRWVDTSSYNYVCDGSGECGYEYRASGYWESGDCSGYWLRRCSDGTEKRY